MSRRLLQIVASLDPSPDVAIVVSVSRRMVAEGYEVAIVSLQEAEAGPAKSRICGSQLEPRDRLAAELRQNGVTVLAVDRPARHATQMAYRLRSVIRAFRPDMVHTWSVTANRFGRLAAATAGIPMVIASHRTIDARAPWWSSAMDRRLDRRTRVRVVNTQAAFDHYRQSLDQPGALRLIRDGVVRRERSTGQERQAVRCRLGVSESTRLVGVVGPLQPERRLKDVIWAVDLLRVFHPDIRLLIIGDGSERWRLQRYAWQVQDRPRTTFLGWRADWPELIASLDCLCQGGTQAFEPAAILEAMSAGVPVVATDVAGHRELIERDVTGLLAPLGDRGAMARQLQRVLDGTPLAERLSTAAQQFVRQHCGHDEMLAQYAELYCDESLGRRGALQAGGFSPSRR